MDENKLRLSWFQRRAMRNIFNKLKNNAVKQDKLIKEILAKHKVLTISEQEQISNYRNKLIESIIGDSKKELVGLNSLFEITDEEGNIVNKEYFEKMSTDELLENFQELVTNLEKEI